jgi:lipoprotein-anchoring transpeptidase ErfK/SrfK
VSPAKAFCCLLVAFTATVAGPATANASERAVPLKTADAASAGSFTYAARIMIRSAGRNRPGFDRPTSSVVHPVSAWSGDSQQLLVLDRAWVDGIRWVKLRLPSRPNDSKTWLPANRVKLIRNPWRVRVSLGRHRVTVLKAGRVLLRFRAVIGAPSTPTPKGLFAIYEKVRQPDPSAFLGPFALHLTAHSKVLDNYGGGPGRVAIHGRSGASLLDPLGSSRSHGCIRIGNGWVRAMARNLPLGTPVHIR